MGDTMREAFERHVQQMPEWEPEFEQHRAWVMVLLQHAWNDGHEAGRQLGMEQARCEPPRHEVDILLQQINDAAMAVDGELYGLPGDDVPWDELRHIVVSWFANNTTPTPPAGDSDTQS